MPEPSNATEAINKAKEEADEDFDYSDGVLTLVDVDFEEYRRRMRNRAVKKNCTIPYWMSEEADKRGVNYSRLLQEALLAFLGGTQGANNLRGKHGRPSKARSSQIYFCYLNHSAYLHFFQEIYTDHRSEETLKTKTQHKSFFPDFHKFAGAVMKIRIPVLAADNEILKDENVYVTLMEDGTAEFKDKTSDIDQQIEDEIDDMLDEISGNDYTPVSFVSADNKDIGLVQFAIRTDDIKK
ncbi:MAG: hypothetical protein ACLUD0_17630 [Eubacterium ramulus]